MINKTLLEKFKSMMFGVGLSKDFCVEALHIVAYVINTSPNTIIDLKTLMNWWGRYVIDYNNLKIFGCDVYAHTKEDKSRKKH